MKIKKEHLAEIYTTSEDTFSVGMKLYEAGDYVLFRVLDEQGKWDGFYMIQKSFIISVEYNTEYLKKIELYMEYWKNSPYQDSAPVNSIFDTNPDLGNLIDYAYKNREIITIAIRSEPELLLAGYVGNHSHGNVLLDCIDISNAKSFETATIAEHEIALLEFESLDNKLLDYAHHHVHQTTFSTNT